MTSSGPETPRRSLLRRIVLGLVVLEVLYLLVGNLFVATSIGPSLLHPKSGKWSVDWKSGWTLIPGLFHLTDADVRWSVRRSEGEVTIDKANVYLVLPSLALRHLNFSMTRATGVEMWVDPVESTTDKPKKTKRGWKFTLGGLDVAELRALGFATEKWAGDGEVEGMISWQIRGPTRLALDRVSLGETQLAPDASRYLDQLELEAENVRFGPYAVSEHDFSDALRTTSGSLELKSHSKSLGFLGYFLKKLSWLDVNGVGELDLAMAVDRGVLESGSRLDFSGPNVEVRYFDFAMRGAGRVEGRVDTEIHLAAELEDFAIDLDDHEDVVHGDDLSVRLTSPSLAVYEPAESLDVVVDLPSAIAPDVSVFSQYVPPAAGLSFSQGEVEVKAAVSYNSGQKTGSGEVSIVGDRIRATLGDFALQFDIDLGVVLSEAKFEEGQVGVAGSRLELSRLFELSPGGVKGNSSSEGWWARVRVPAGDVHRTEIGDGQFRPGVVVDLEADLRDSALVLDFLTARVRKLHWFKSFLSVTDVRAKVGLEVEESTISLRDLSILGGDDIEVLADLTTDQGERTGVLFARYKKLSAALGLGLEGKKPKDWKLTNSREWYESEAAAFGGSE